MFSEKLKILKEKGLLREIRDRASPQGPRVVFRGKEYINFSSNDYLGLSTHPLVIETAKRAMDDYGFGSSFLQAVRGRKCPS